MNYMNKIIPLIALFVVPALLTACQQDPEAARKAHCVEVKNDMIRGARGLLTEEEGKAALEDWRSTPCTLRDIKDPPSTARYDAASRG